VAFVGDNIQDFPALTQAIRKQGDEAFAAFGTRSCKRSRQFLRLDAAHHVKPFTSGTLRGSVGRVAGRAHSRKCQHR
jgi:hypothetical protein